MKLIFKQRFFSWFDSYDIYDEWGNVFFEVKGEFAWGHLLRIYSPNGEELGCVKEKVFTWLPQFEIYAKDEYLGCIKKEFSLFKPSFSIDFNGWSVQGDWLGWDYQICDAEGAIVANISKEIFNFTDTYVLDIYNLNEILSVLMLALAIDAEKCTGNG